MSDERQPITQHERNLVAQDKCPRCRGELDTGWECTACGYDAMPIAHGASHHDGQIKQDNTGDGPNVA